MGTLFRTSIKSKMKLLNVLPIVLVAAQDCQSRGLPADRWNCGADDVTGVNVCSRTTCQHNILYRKGCYCDDSGKCFWEWLSPNACPESMKPVVSVTPSKDIGRRRKKKTRSCPAFDTTDGWHCSKSGFQKNTVCHKRCVNFGVAFKRCRCPRGRPLQPCKWSRKTTNKECFTNLSPDPAREMINLSLNKPSKLPSAFLRDFVDGETFEYDTEETTTETTTASTAATTTLKLDMPKEKKVPKELPKTQSGLSAAVHKAQNQINEWVGFLQQLLHFDQLTVISIDKGTMKE